ncbi:unnamed protein product [Merluccius merluccius]
MPHPHQDFSIEEQEVLTGTSSCYLVESFRGEGTFGKVATCVNMDTKQTVAVKILKKTQNNMIGTEKELAVAFQALKAKGIIHTDLKADNIMFVNKRDQPLKVKLIDFGVAIPVSQVALGKTLQAVPYRAPEVVLGLPITEAIDIWSLDCVIASLFLGDHLYLRMSF